MNVLMMRNSEPRSACWSEDWENHSDALDEIFPSLCWIYDACDWYDAAFIDRSDIFGNWFLESTSFCFV